MISPKICRTLALCGALLCAVLPSTQGASFPSAAFPDGVGVNTGFQYSLSATDISRLQAAGIKYLRIDLKWRDMETPKNTYNWGSHDALVAQMNAAGFKPIFLISYGNDHYGSNGITMDEADEIQGFANFAVAALNRYETAGAIWEIWNEQNTHDFWAVADPLNTETTARGASGELYEPDQRRLPGHAGGQAELHHHLRRRVECRLARDRGVVR